MANRTTANLVISSCSSSTDINDCLPLCARRRSGVKVRRKSSSAGNTDAKRGVHVLAPPQLLPVPVWIVPAAIVCMSASLEPGAAATGDADTAKRVCSDGRCGSSAKGIA